jgi:dimethylglycine dehydrogenase
MLGVDPRRFGPYAGRLYLKAKNEEAYANVFTPHYPDEERSAARPLKAAPCYDRMKTLGAVFGSVYGWERPNWFAPPGYGFDASALGGNENHPPPDANGRIQEVWSFRRSNSFPHVGNEIRTVTTGVGLQDSTRSSRTVSPRRGAASLSVTF